MIMASWRGLAGGGAGVVDCESVSALIDVEGRRVGARRGCWLMYALEDQLVRCGWLVGFARLKV